MDTLRQPSKVDPMIRFKLALASNHCTNSTPSSWRSGNPFVPPPVSYKKGGKEIDIDSFQTILYVGIWTCSAINKLGSDHRDIRFSAYTTCSNNALLLIKFID
ncbi:hypothetical protein CHS0354_042394 [Potamilus streckersoni]|uniref:Uncharacterized protein n=1 Tax=Potamilus streckersoni TaxID=2493646 RepID=A0AAE0STN1_9BIVA|nr:hypothetical protein CHS0354_042394 [Potamilus streckersoni]